MDKEIELTTLYLMFPSLELDEVDTSYSLIIDVCEHFNRLDRQDLWKNWLSLNMAVSGEIWQFKGQLQTKLIEDFAIRESINEKSR